ncbi:9419_t:CDS:2 [Paraglomus occultum]|uniref:Sepiapterin reductase n=1 Tax=Paraglomus occultum TaxID=144539 RepID=A0A9N9C1B4_9GLOM|nr:9419_t:CDS:2 [Paraglomus occultum]
MTGHHLCIIVGANRGFGREIALTYASTVAAQKNVKLSFVLIGRNLDQLRSTAQSIENDDVHVSTIANFDLGDIDNLDENIGAVSSAIEKLIKSNTFTKSILINNAGTLGDLSVTVKDYNWKEAKRHLDVNVTSFVALCSMFLKLIPVSSTNQRVIVNISSLYATRPCAYWGTYCMTKAARDQLIGVIALEEDGNNTKTLNYAPGPLDNEMQALVRNTIGDDDQRRQLLEGFEKGQLVNMSDSAKKLVNLILSDSYKSGSHVDFYDI